MNVIAITEISFRDTVVQYQIKIGKLAKKSICNFDLQYDPVSQLDPTDYFKALAACLSTIY